jgi:hypothetical protein
MALAIITNRLSLLSNTLFFFRQHFLLIMVLGLIAAIGRVVQLGGFGEVPGSINMTLEVVVELSRILLMLFVLGLANIKSGALRIIHFFAHKVERKTVLMTAVHKLKKHWFSVFLNVLAFLMMAWGINYLIDLAAYETCFYFQLKNRGILAPSSSEWTLLLFFKNLTVIPLTLVFDAIVILWLSNRLIPNRTLSIA